ncbi:MAG: polysaccharide deacetylase family protein [Ferruginibacter sp.]
MKQLFVTLLTLGNLIVNAQSTPLQYEVACWQGNKAAAVSITFDDCMPSQFEHAIPVLDDASRKIRATFFLTGKSIPANTRSVIQAYETGHEIANHSFTHPSKMADLAATEIDAELKSCQDATHHLFNKTVSFTMAYPNGSGQDTAAKDLVVRKILRKYFIGARAT